MFSDLVKPENRTAEYYETVMAPLREEAAQFKKDFSKKELEADGETMEWFGYKESDAQLGMWLEDSIAFVDHYVSGEGLVAHGKRHVAIDVASGLQLAREADDSKVVSLSVIPSFLHDAGRLIEPLFAGKVDAGVLYSDHAVISYSVAKRFEAAASEMMMPKHVFDTVLHAILVHSGKGAETLTDHLVQTADKEQLVGPEGLARHMGVHGGTLATPLIIEDAARRSLYPCDCDNHDGQDALLAAGETYGRLLYPQATGEAEYRAFMFKRVNVAFTSLACPNDGVREQSFAVELGHALPEMPPEGTGGWPKKMFNLDVYNAGRKEASAFPEQEADVDFVVDYVFNAPGEGRPEAAVQLFKEKFNDLTPAAQKSLTTAYAYAKTKRDTEDVKRLEVLQYESMRTDFRSKAARWALNVLKVA